MTPARAAARREAGVSTLEALVAVAVLGIAFLPLLVFQSQISRTYARYQQEYAEAVLKRNALAVFRDMNIAQTPSGTITLGTGQTLTWTSTPITAERQSVGFPVDDGQFRVAIYRVTATLSNAPPDAPQRIETTLTLDRLGWRSSPSVFGGSATMP